MAWQDGSRCWPWHQKHNLRVQLFVFKYTNRAGRVIMDERDHGFPTLNEKNPTIIIFQCVINGTLDSLELLFCKCQLTFLSNCQSFHLFWEMLHTLGGKGTNISFGPKCLNCCKGWLAYVICNASSLSFLPSNSGTKQDFVLRAGRGRWVWWGYVLTLPVLSGQNLGLLGTWILPFLSMVISRIANLVMR